MASASPDSMRLDLARPDLAATASGSPPRPRRRRRRRPPPRRARSGRYCRRAPASGLRRPRCRHRAPGARASASGLPAGRSRGSESSARHVQIFKPLYAPDPSQRCLLSRLIACLISSTSFCVSARMAVCLSCSKWRIRIGADHRDAPPACKAKWQPADPTGPSRSAASVQAAAALADRADWPAATAPRRDRLRRLVHADHPIAVGRPGARLEGLDDRARPRLRWPACRSCG